MNGGDNCRRWRIQATSLKSTAKSRNEPAGFVILKRCCMNWPGCLQIFSKKNEGLVTSRESQFPARVQPIQHGRYLGYPELMDQPIKWTGIYQAFSPGLLFGQPVLTSCLLAIK